MIRNIDIPLLRAFLAVVENGSVTKAAGSLNLTQAAVSQQIKRLEELFNAAIFDREQRRLTLTPAGERLLGQARRMVGLNDEIMDMMRTPDHVGDVKLGVPHDIVTAYLPAVLGRFDKAYPRADVSLVSAPTADLLALLERGELDLMLSTELDCPAQAEPLLADQLVWVGAHVGDAHLRRPLPVSLGAKTCMFRKPAVKALDAAGIPWRPVCQVSEMEPLLATLEAGIAVAPMLRSVIPKPLRVLAADSGLPRLPRFSINLRIRGSVSHLATALAHEIRAEFGVHAKPRVALRSPMARSYAINAQASPARKARARPAT